MRVKPIEAFGRCRRSKGGRLPRCSACTRAANKAWRESNPEAAKEHQARYREKDRKARYSSHDRWRKNNPERAAEVMLASHRKHKGRINANTAARYAARKSGTPAWLTPEQKQQMRETYDLAALATETLGEPYEVDHIVPLRGKRVCGLHVPWNLRVVRAADNRAKGNRF